MRCTSTLIFIFLLLFSACTSKRKRIMAEQSHPVRENYIPLPPVQYNYLVLDSSTRSTLKHQYNDTQLHTLLALNRIDFSRLYRVDTLVAPDTFVADFKRYSPFADSLPLLAEVHKVLLFDYKIQAFATYEQGKLARWGPVSMGKQSTPTPTGLFHTNWRAKKTISTEDSTWILYWYYNIHNERGVSIHQYELPGYPASHACMRLYEEDAKWIYYWADGWKLSADYMQVLAYGTPVIVFGRYDFKAKAPWYQLPGNPTALHVQNDSLTKEITPYLPTILQRQYQRDSSIAAEQDTILHLEEIK